MWHPEFYIWGCVSFYVIKILVVWGQVHKMSCWSPLCCSKGFPDYDFVLLFLVPEIVSNSVMQIFIFPWVLCRFWCLICQLIVGVVWCQTLTCGSHSFATVTVVWTANNCSPSGSLSSSIHSSLNLVQHFKTLGWYRASFPWTVVSILCVSVAMSLSLKQNLFVHCCMTREM